MILSNLHNKILRAEICPYCKSDTKIVSEQFIYGISFKNRNIICCANHPKCNSYVGTHENGKPLGRLANKELRKTKIEAHFHFDKIWKEKYIDRSDLYLKLSNYLNIPEDYTHIGMFSQNTCLKTIEWAKKIYNANKPK